MRDPIDTICELVGCSREIAEESYAKTKSTLDSVEQLLATPPKKYKLPSVQKPEQTPEQIELERIRKIMEQAEREIHEKIKKQTLTGSNPLESDDSRVTSTTSEVEIPEIEKS